MTRELGAFSFDIAKRILDYLHENGKMKKTNLATGTGLNYNVCMRYVKMLMFLGWLEVDPNVQISVSGREVRRKLSDFGLASNSITDSGSSVNQPVGERQFSVFHEGNERPATETWTIMLVDDEPDVALTFESFLCSAGYKVKVHTDPRKALREFAMAPFQFELVILDIRMPDINGIKLYQIINALNPACRVLFVSSLDSARELANSLCGVNQTNIIKKPIEEKAFIKIVKTTLKR